MKRNHLVAALSAFTLGAPGAALAAEVVETDTVTVDVGGRLQVLGFGQRLEDPTRDDNRMYLFLKQGRLNVATQVEDWRFRLQLALGGEGEVKAPSPGVVLDLLDLYADAPLPIAKTYVRVGQFKMPYGRERLTDSAVMPFADRSVQNMAFRMGRDVGAMLHTNAGPFVGGVGVFTGGGRDIPERYLPQILGIPLVAMRVGYATEGTENVFAERNHGGVQYALAAPTQVEHAAFLNAFYMKDSQVGHSSVLSTRPAEKNLLINTNWNPYLAQSPLSRGRHWMVGADYAVRAPVGPGFVTGEVEANYAVFQNGYGRLAVPGGRVQAGYSLGNIGAHLRYAAFVPDENFRSGTVAITGKELVQEVTPALTYTFGKHARVVADLPVHLNTPVVTENNIGAYTVVEQPDQVSYIKPTRDAQGNTIAAVGSMGRQTVINARLMFEANF